MMPEPCRPRRRTSLTNGCGMDADRVGMAGAEDRSNGTNFFGGDTATGAGAATAGAVGRGGKEP